MELVNEVSKEGTQLAVKPVVQRVAAVMAGNITVLHALLIYGIAGTVVFLKLFFPTMGYGSVLMGIITAFVLRYSFEYGGILNCIHFNVHRHVFLSNVFCRSGDDFGRLDCMNTGDFVMEHG
ncbi:hypothetical protein [Acinetobacter rudis]|uniref:Uncharacterized protein n=1 Tax=Acinetobacter rudis CIP 110305 TaxID=421052 RepID=S3MU05_9GAMM|nr:hypothetical protein [Acinetobacter rudis]EPF71042.1 hypothetical protein F945_02805 [Acinetobacter rudis CIP 110305]